MPTPKYNFSENNGQLLVELDNTSNLWDNEEKKEYRAASVSLFGNKIYLTNYDRDKKDFLFENFGTIGGVAPSNLDDAYTKLLALIPAGTI